MDGNRVTRRRALVARMLVIQGALLIVVAVIHLVMTSEIGQIVARNTTAKADAFLWPPYALDHVVAGILLFPIGITAMLCAGGIRAGDRRIWWIAFVNAVAVLSMPFAIAFTVGLSYFATAPAFLAGAALISLVGLWMVWPLLWIYKDIFAGTPGTIPPAIH